MPSTCGPRRLDFRVDGIEMYPEKVVRSFFFWDCICCCCPHTWGIVANPRGNQHGMPPLGMDGVSHKCDPAPWEARSTKVSRSRADTIAGRCPIPRHRAGAWTPEGRPLIVRMQSGVRAHPNRLSPSPPSPSGKAHLLSANTAPQEVHGSMTTCPQPITGVGPARVGSASSWALAWRC